MLSPEAFMRRALEVAERGAGWVNPNPMVGAVVVKRNIIVSEGWHERYGGAHAEFIALERAGALARGADLYLTLEPCVAAPHKRNPPCADLIVDSRIKRVFVAMRDPDPRIHGRGIAHLRQAGLDVIEGVREREARKLNEIYIKFKTTGKPFITLKMAMSADGKIATHTGDSKYISGEASLRLAHELRARHRALLVGIETVLQDDPQLTVRLGRPAPQPLRIVVDSRGRLPVNAKIFQSPSPIVLATTEALAVEDERKFCEKNVQIWRLPAEHGRVDPVGLIGRLAAEQIDSVLVEGGAEIAWSFLSAQLVDKIIFVIAPKILGGRAAPGPVGGSGVARLTEALTLREVSVRTLGEDVIYEAYVQKR
ncbi:MAG: bifunctional diaminohydroxyphosphoribosylaminopyrimidine deaminase/5-amino-6-(5-phosphoribosylamino)uracil reductase RibD [Candidatus Bipolaricaulota bacterium]|nr:bifunctional diaminohydroxyphosphoribosylaminopyrimidine deaminase/5-amino-6-(5-phosphoribosylamino)uracil reductase RibD [Candidatus Bipolaricaulota bacterium]